VKSLPSLSAPHVTTGGGTTVSAKTQRLGRHRQPVPQGIGAPERPHRWVRLVAAISVAGVAVALFFVFAVSDAGGPAQAVPPSAIRPHRSGVSLPATPDSYLGLYANGVPSSYAGVAAFTTATGVKPDLVLYYSGWFEPFQTSFATTVADHGGVPLVQMDPQGISIAAIASGTYDSYLSAYAASIRAYRRPVVLGFGHEMNGYWYSWGYKNTPSTAFVAAWRHIVTLFRAAGARNVTWMWTVNTIHSRANVPNPKRWWPGSAYVNWIGIDGYYFNPASTFASLFGPTIAAVRTFASNPILIGETAAAGSVQSTKIVDLFAGTRLYGLLGFVWFDSAARAEDWRVTSPAAIAAFQHSAQAYHMPSSRDVDGLRR
jgi:mannan endo-1,4-beta-mannosidase